MSDIKSHRDLEAWQVAMEMVMKTYLLSSTSPRAETYGLTGQMRRAAVSGPSNIAEGQARGPGRAGLNYLSIALGSLAELDTQMALALRLGYATAASMSDLERCLRSSRRLVYGLQRAKRRQLATSVSVTIAAGIPGVAFHCTASSPPPSALASVPVLRSALPRFPRPPPTPPAAAPPPGRRARRGRRGRTSASAAVRPRPSATADVSDRIERADAVQQRRHHARRQAGGHHPDRDPAAGQQQSLTHEQRR